MNFGPLTMSKKGSQRPKIHSAMTELRESVNTKFVLKVVFGLKQIVVYKTTITKTKKTIKLKLLL